MFLWRLVVNWQWRRDAYSNSSRVRTWVKGGDSYCDVCKLCYLYLLVGWRPCVLCASVTPARPRPGVNPAMVAARPYRTPLPTPIRSQTGYPRNSIAAYNWHPVRSQPYMMTPWLNYPYQQQQQQRRRQEPNATRHRPYYVINAYSYY